MQHYMVFASTDKGTRLQWGNPLGVYKTDDPSAACKAAATEHHYIGTFAAVECVLWGVDMLASEVEIAGAAAGFVSGAADLTDHIVH